MATLIFSEFSHAIQRYRAVADKRITWSTNLENEYKAILEDGKSFEDLRSTGNKHERVLKEVVEYFLNQVLRNPRLLYYWSHPKEDLQRIFYDQAQIWHEKLVKGDGVNEMDEQGPFPIGSVPVDSKVASISFSSSYGTRWGINSKSPLTSEQKEDMWAKAYEDAKGGFVSMAVDVDFKKKLLSEIEAISAGGSKFKNILLVGCGVEGVIENEIAQMFPDAIVYCGDFEKVVEQVNEENKEKNVKYIPLDTTQLDEVEKYELIINLDTVASDSHNENTTMMTACHRALTFDGIYIGTFSSVFAWVDIAYLEDEFEGQTNGRMHLVDLARSSILKVPESEKHPDVWRIYYTPLRLRYLLQQTGFDVKKIELYFCDSKYFIDATKIDYEIQDPDLPLYEHYVVAKKQETGESK